MAGHNFNFDGGEILSRIGAAWFVSYAYHDLIDKTFMAWDCDITEKSLCSRKSKYNNSTFYHKAWLQEVLKMEQLDKHKNKVGLRSTEIKKMAKKILTYLEVSKPTL